MIDLTGRVALVTGGSRGIGRATAVRLAEAGADVVVNYLSARSEAMKTAERIQSLGRKAFVVKADVSEKDDIEEMVDFVQKQIGRLDIVVSNAASGGFRPLLTATKMNFEATMNTNVLPLLHLAQATYPLLKQGPHRGKVVAISSHGSLLALPFYGLIGTSKAALESLARQLTLEVGDFVNVNIVLAGLVETDSTRNLPGSEAMFEGRKLKTMVGDRVLLPENVADAVCFLASSMSDLIQGATLIVDGGSAIHV